MGGDGALQHCDYSAEFIEFLKELEKEGPDTELLIVGDTFGFWELTLEAPRGGESSRKLELLSLLFRLFPVIRTYFPVMAKIVPC